LYFLSPRKPEINFITELFWIEKSTAKVRTIDVWVRKVMKLPRKFTARLPISLA
jgi:hypothetical protein